jgi:DHA2 family multidrug resistance protein-like MFS transporter
MAGRREWTGLAVLALPTLLVSIDFSVLFLALPKLSADLGPSSAQLLWIGDIYGFMIAGFLITMGTLGDRIGRRRLLLLGAAAFGATSVLAAFSGSAAMLIASRALMGIAGATLMPSTLALITNMFEHPRQRATAIGAWFSFFLAGIALGPILGGLLLQSFWWGSVFLAGVPVMVVLLLVAPRLLPEHRAEQAGRLDPTSVTLSLAGILPVVYGLKEIAQDGLQAATLLAMLLGLAFGAAFVRRQRSLPDPLLDLRLFRNPTFSAALAVMLPGTLLPGAVSLFAAQYLQLVAGLSPLQAGLWLLPSALGTIAGAMLGPALARRMRPADVIAAGVALAGVGFLVLTQVDSGSGLAVLVAGGTIAFLGIAPTGVLATDMVVGSAPAEQAGSASAVSETTAELGAALGVAIFGSVGTAIYRSQVDAAVPANTPAAAVEAARDSLAGAASAAADLPAPLGPELLDTAREAFTGALNLVAGVGVVAMVVFAVLALTLRRRIGPAEPTADQEATAGLEGRPGW